LKPEDRYATETRALLDLIAYEVTGLGLPAGSELLVRTTDADLHSDLADRLPQHRLMEAVTPGTAAGIYLFSAEAGQPTPAADGLHHALLAFNNRSSHRTLLAPGRPGLGWTGAERQFSGRYTLTNRWGLMGPGRVAWLLASAAADRVGRHDFGFHWADRAMLSPAISGPMRQLSPVGLLVGRRASKGAA
jgi:hypothetical protein